MSNEKYLELKFSVIEENIGALKEGQDIILKKLESFDDRFVSRREFEAAQEANKEKLSEVEKKYEQLNTKYLYAGGAIAVVLTISAFFLPRIFDKLFN